MPDPNNPRIRALKAQAQRLKPILKVGKEGLSGAFLSALDEALKSHELVKIKFDCLKEQKKELGSAMAKQTRSRVVMRVGHVVVLFRSQQAAQEQEL